MGELNLLEKTEIWVSDIELEQANLTDMAAAVARVLGLADDKIMVVDVRPDHVTFDLLDKEIPQENIMGKEYAILQALAEIPGVSLGEDACVHSNGILGLICADEGATAGLIDNVRIMREEIAGKVAHRAIVFPTGFELEQGLIEDTNTPYIKTLLEENGYTVTVGKVIPDNEYAMTEILSEALDRGYGLIVTTGGVGAEDKDHSVESIVNVDPSAATPYIVKYEAGHGRHVKDGVRIGVGRVGLTTLVSLPGPHDEVEMTAPILVKMLADGSDKAVMAEALAEKLRDKWKKKSEQWHHHHSEQ